MQAVILAAGKGTRLKPLTDKTPKPLLEIKKGMTILDRLVDSLPDSVEELIMVVNYKKDLIKKKYQEFKGKSIKYVFHEKLDGTAMALWQTKDYLKKDFMLIHGDDIYEKEDLEELIKNDLAILAYEKQGLPSGGVIQYEIKNNQNKQDFYLKEIIDYPKTGYSDYLLNTGAYKLNQEFFKFKPVPMQKNSQEFGLPQTLSQMTKDHLIKIITTKKYFQINTVDDLEFLRGLIEL
jgi:NDP-sugar pyrophosphorylase family protein